MDLPLNSLKAIICNSLTTAIEVFDFKFTENELINASGPTSCKSPSLLHPEN